MNTIICLSGKAGSGKDTVAAMLKSELESKGHSAHIIILADLLKYICTSQLGWDGKKDEEGRSLLQRVGTDVIRANEPSFFADFVAKMIGWFGDQWDYIIVPDCRFKNELSILRDCGYKLKHLYVVRDMQFSKLTEYQQHHSSETEMDSVVPDAYINNFGTIEDLKITVRNYIKFMEDYL